MPIKRYDPKSKAAFLKAATDARTAGKLWPEVHAAAKAAGYPGTVKGIVRMLESAGPKAKPQMKSATPVPAAKKTAALKPVTKPSVKTVTASKPAAKPSRAAKPAPATKPQPVPTPKAAAKAPGTPGQRYSPAMKSAIMGAAIAARGKGTWADAHKAAKAVGYRGSVQGIVKMIRAGNRKQRDRKPIAAKQVAVKRGPGRPKGSAIKRGPGRPKGTGIRLGRPALNAVSVNGLGSIQAAVDQIVRERISAALDQAIAVLQAI